MRIKKEFMRIARLPGTVGGAKLEAEQQPAQRVQVVDANVTSKAGKQLGSITTEIIAEHSAQELANIERAKCYGCKNFRNADWLKIRNAMQFGSLEKRQELNRIRAALLTTANAKIHQVHDNDGETDVEHAISMLGVCGPLTEIDGTEAIIVHPMGNCPDDVCSMARPNGLFEPKDQDSDRAGAGNYDRIMRIAQGRTI